MRFNPGLKLTLHKEFNELIQGNKIAPINLEVSPSGMCDSNCPWCFYKDEHKKEFIDVDKLKDALVEFKELGLKAITWTGGGEPTLHPRFTDLTRFVDDLEVEQGLITNALKTPLYDPSLFKWIRVSVTPKGLNMKNLKILRKCESLGICLNQISGHNPFIDSLFLNPNSEEEMEVDYIQIRPALNTKGNYSNILKPITNNPLFKITDYKYEDQSEPRQYSKCYGYNFVPFLWEDGELDVCAYHRGNLKYNIGNIYTHSVKHLLGKMPRYVETCDTCQICCKNHEINKTINNAIKIKDVNFV